MAKIKLKPKSRKGIITVKTLIKHPMETGLRKKKGKLVPANYIVHMGVAVNGKPMVVADIGSTISKDPYFQFKIPGNKGDTVTLKYEDSRGKKGSKTKKSR